jgi:hypothetical protein
VWQAGARVAAPPSDLLALHRRNNRESAGLWQDFAEHRARVTALALAEAPAAGGTLAVLGAGNANDLDLAALAARFAQIHLVDLDEEAVSRARDRQPADIAAKLVVRAPVDLSGAFFRLDGFRRQPATPNQLATLAGSSADAVVAALPGQFDVVLSTCFLSQLMQSAFHSLGERHPQLHIIACALALAHVRSVARLVRPGGAGHLVTDAATTDTYPLVDLWDQQAPLALLEHLEASDNVFSGTGPSFLRRILATDKQVAPLLAGAARVVEPWLWRFTEERTYLVYALSFRRQ